MEFLLILLDAAQQPNGSSSSFWIMILLIILIFYFFLIRPQKKRQKQEEEFRNGLKKGDKVMTSGGIYGKVVETKDTTIVIDIADHVHITVHKNFVQPLSEDQLQKPKAKEEKQKQDEEPKKIDE